MMPLILSKKNSLSQGQNMVLWLLVVVLLKALTLLLWVIFMMFLNTLLESFFVILWNFIRLLSRYSVWRMKGRLKLFQHKVGCLILGNLLLSLLRKPLSKLKMLERFFKDVNYLQKRNSIILLHEIKKSQQTTGYPTGILVLSEKSWEDEIGSIFEPIFFI